MDLNLMSELLAKSYPGHKVEHLWVIVAIDGQGSEGIPAVLKKGAMTPLICSDQKKVDNMKKAAKGLIASDPTMRLVLRQFGDAIDLEEIHDGQPL